MLVLILFVAPFFHSLFHRNLQERSIVDEPVPVAFIGTYKSGSMVDEPVPVAFIGTYKSGSMVDEPEPVPVAVGGSIRPNDDVWHRVMVTTFICYWSICLALRFKNSHFQINNALS
ncbi:hypothetical protein Sjap_016330 [Stephania japonica]|uniref:Uncharacterized protein n=1 Tax=Stephania japonica TaxID=461633 RepID=A0AAP0NS99_9MAGN